MFCDFCRVSAIKCQYMCYIGFDIGFEEEGQNRVEVVVIGKTWAPAL